MSEHIRFYVKFAQTWLPAFAYDKILSIGKGSSIPSVIMITSKSWTPFCAYHIWCWHTYLFCHGYWYIFKLKGVGRNKCCSQRLDWKNLNKGKKLNISLQIQELSFLLTPKHRTTKLLWVCRISMKKKNTCKCVWQTFCSRTFSSSYVLF